jgi:hypothetical protein
MRALAHEFTTVKPAAFLPGRYRADCEQDIDDKEEMILIDYLGEKLATAMNVLMIAVFALSPRVDDLNVRRERTVSLKVEDEVKLFQGGFLIEKSIRRGLHGK